VFDRALAGAILGLAAAMRHRDSVARRRFFAGMLVLANLEKTFHAAMGPARWRMKFVGFGIVIGFGTRVFTLSQVLLDSVTKSDTHTRRLRRLARSLLLHWHRIPEGAVSQSWISTRPEQSCSASARLFTETLDVLTAKTFIIAPPPPP
jgi:hypothetical protein